jgi:hypothetical protein
MSAMKRLHAEYRSSGYALTGFPVQDREAWRRLLPDEIVAQYRPVKFEAPTLPMLATMGSAEPPFDPNV